MYFCPSGFQFFAEPHLHGFPSTFFLLLLPDNIAPIQRNTRLNQENNTLELKKRRGTTAHRIGSGSGSGVQQRTGSGSGVQQRTGQKAEAGYNSAQVRKRKRGTTAHRTESGSGSRSGGDDSDDV